MLDYALLHTNTALHARLIRWGGVSALIAEAKLDARTWIDGKEYSIEKTIKQLAAERE